METRRGWKPIASPVAPFLSHSLAPSFFLLSLRCRCLHTYTPYNEHTSTAHRCSQSFHLLHVPGWAGRLLSLTLLPIFSLSCVGARNGNVRSSQTTRSVSSSRLYYPPQAHLFLQFDFIDTRDFTDHGWWMRIRYAISLTRVATDV